MEALCHPLQTMLDGLDFVRQPGAFEVSYRGSAEPQELRIEVETKDRATRRSGPVVLRKILDMINFGAAGGHHFAPELCAAERVSGPWDGDDAFGPSYHWILKVSGVAPEFLRLAVEHLRRCGWDQPVTAMRIHGALAPDDSVLSVRTLKMQTWLADPATYPHAFATERFPIHTSESTGVLYRVAFAQPLSESQTEVLQAMCARWLAATATLADHQGNTLVRTPELLEQMLPSFETASESFSARMQKFGHAAQPSAALLLNMLARFHVTQSRIFSVELALEGLSAPALQVRTPSPAPSPAARERDSQRSSEDMKASSFSVRAAAATKVKRTPAPVRATAKRTAATKAKSTPAPVRAIDTRTAATTAKRTPAPVRATAATKVKRTPAPVRGAAATTAKRTPAPVRAAATTKAKRTPSPVRATAATTAKRTPAPVRATAKRTAATKVKRTPAPVRATAKRAAATKAKRTPAPVRATAKRAAATKAKRTPAPVRATAKRTAATKATRSPSPAGGRGHASSKQKTSRVRAKAQPSKKPISKKVPPRAATKKKATQYSSAERRLSKKASARSSRSAKTRSKRPSSPKASR